MAEKKTFAIDFDGVVHKYSKGWQDGSIYDGEMESALKSIGKIFARGHRAFVFSSRSSRQINSWLNDQLWYWDAFNQTPTLGDDLEKVYIYGYRSCVIPFWKKFWDVDNTLGVTKRKLPAHVYIDDRAYVFQDWEETLYDLGIV
jgi:hypothetical protein